MKIVTGFVTIYCIDAKKNISSPVQFSQKGIIKLTFLFKDYCYFWNVSFYTLTKWEKHIII